MDLLSVWITIKQALHLNTIQYKNMNICMFDLEVGLFKHCARGVDNISKVSSAPGGWLLIDCFDCFDWKDAATRKW